jgi:hypothetical protein
MLTGHPGFRRETYERDLAALPAPLVAIIDRACRRDPADRYATAADFSADLAAIAPHKLRLRASEGRAICTNPMCVGTQWEEWVEGPTYPQFENCTANHCEDCGHALTHDCSRCGNSFGGKRYCAVCGSEFYTIPRCEQCGCALRQWDLRDAHKKCDDCRKPPRRAKPRDDDFGGGYVPQDPGDDDVPF